MSIFDSIRNKAQIIRWL